MRTPEHALALYETLREFFVGGSPYASALPDIRPFGKGLTLRLKDEAEGLPPFTTTVSEPIVEHHEWPARQFAVRLRAGLEEIGTVGGGSKMLPFGLFLVEATISGSTTRYEIDGQFFEQVLSVVAERIRVTVQWDNANVNAKTKATLLSAPIAANFYAALAHSTVRGTALRSLVVDNTAVANATVKIPPGARGLLVRLSVATYAATVGTLTWQGGGATPAVLDVVPAAAVKAAHDAGAYLSVPSWADTAVIQVLASNAGELLLAEFQIGP